MCHPRTAILVLCHNGLEVTKNFLSKLYMNTDNFVLFILDNGSTDGTADYLKEFSLEHFENVVLFLNPTNLGVIGGRNFLFEEMFRKYAKQLNYLIFLDNDQFVDNGWLVQYHDFMREGEFDLVGAEAWQLDRNLRPVRKLSSPSLAPSKEVFSYVGCGGMLMKVEVPLAIGMFDTIYNPCYFEDPDYNFRCIESGFKIGWNDRAKIVHFAHQTIGKRDDKRSVFRNSYTKFYAKWHKKNMPYIRGHTKISNKVM